MTRTYTKAIDDVLRPVGFSRQGSNWIRTRGDIEEKVNLQKSWIDGSVTVNLYARDIETDKILKNIDCEEWLGIIQFGARIGELIDGRDRWWKNNPNGPAEVAAAVSSHGIPWFDRVRTLEEQIDQWYGRSVAYPWNKPNLPAFAVTLYRLGMLDEALALFEAPVPKTAISNLVAKGRCVQRWLQAQKDKKQPRKA